MNNEKLTTTTNGDAKSDYETSLADKMAVVKAKVARTPRAARKSAVIALAPITKPRSGKVSVFFDKVMKALSGPNGATVEHVARTLKIKDREVRGAIDKARNALGYHAVARIAPRTFRYLSDKERAAAAPKTGKRAKA